MLSERDENRENCEEKFDISDGEQDVRIQNGGWAVMTSRGLNDQKSDSLIRKLSGTLKSRGRY